MLGVAVGSGQHFLDHIADGIAVFDAEGQIAFLNQRGADIFGRSRQELLGQNGQVLGSAAFGSQFTQTYQQARYLQISTQIQQFCDRLNAWFEIRFYPSEDCLVVLFYDISQRKHSEAALQQTCEDLEHLLVRKAVRLFTESVQRKQVEATLQDTNATLAKVLGTITDGLCAVDRAWRFTYVNPRAEGILQQSQVELLGKTLWTVFPEMVGTLFYRCCQEAVSYQRSLQFEEYSTALGCWLEYNLYPSCDGLSVYFRDITARKQVEYERNKLLRREQLARQQAELAEQRCAFVAEVSRVLAGSLDYATTLTTVVDAIVPFLADYCVLQQLEPDGRLRPVAAIHHQPDQQALVDALACQYSRQHTPQDLTAAVLRSGEPYLVSECSYELLASLVSSEPMRELCWQLQPRSAMVVPLMVRGEPLGVLLLATADSDRRYTQDDVSLAMDVARRAAMAIDNAQLYQQAQVANRLKDEFLSTVSHEVRTPLHIISGWAQMLLNRNFDPATVQHGMEVIDRNAKELVQLMRELLDLACISTGQISVDLTPLCLNEVMHESIARLNSAATSKSIRLETHATHPPLMVLGDRERVHQIVWHLVSNAIKFTPAGGRVDVRLEMVPGQFQERSSSSQRDTAQAAQLDDSQSSSVSSELLSKSSDGSPPDPSFCECQTLAVAKITVTDTGQGIAPEFLPYVCDRFRQGDGSTTRSHGGLGIGLALVKSLAELHGGTVQITSPGEGKGTTAQVCLPLIF